MSMRWGFRVATAARHGQGHIARSLAVAQAYGSGVTFFVDPGPGAAGAVRAGGFDCEQEGGETDCGAVHAALRDGRIDGVLYDGYAFVGTSCRAAIGRVFPKVRFDDFGTAGDADLVVAGGLDDAAAPAAGPGRAVLCGPAYAALARDFAAAHRRAESRDAGGAVRRILVSFGARDGADNTGLTLDALARAGFVGEIVVALGAHAPHRARLAERIARQPGLRLEIGRDSMIPLYESCDLAIGAAGMSMLERLCCGLPQIVVRAAANQDRNAAAAARLGVAAVAAPQAELLAGAIAALCADPERRRRMAQAGWALVDGSGAERIAAAMRKLEKAG